MTAPAPAAGSTPHPAGPGPAGPEPTRARTGAARTVLGHVGTGVLAVVVAAAASLLVQAAVGGTPLPLPSAATLPPGATTDPVTATTATHRAALTTLSVVLALVLLGGSAWVLVVARRVRAGLVATWATLSVLVTVLLAVPLGATPLYLGGVSIDQQFRTQLLTRLTDSPALSDMNYADIAPYYPSGWFWLGGRFSALLGREGWDGYKPWAILSLAVAAVLALVLWTRVVSPARALAATLASTTALLAAGAIEPYGAVVSLLGPPAMVLAWQALSTARARAVPVGAAEAEGPVPDRLGSWGRVVVVGVFLGAAAVSYTLYLLVFALTVVVMAVLAGGLALRRRGTLGRGAALVPVGLRLLVAGAVAVVLALLVWTPYLLAVLRGEPASGAAQRYLPQLGATVPLPMTELTLLGALCLAGTVWLAVRLRTSRVAQALAITLACLYGYSLLSLAWLFLDTTLLGFRLVVPIESVLTAAGALAVLDAARTGVAALARRQPALRGRVVGATVAVGVLVTLAFVQAVPAALAPEVALAYSDPAVDGTRADGQPADDARFYPELDRVLAAGSPVARRDTVVLTTDYRFMAFHPYRGFQQTTPHYANPHADYDARAAEVARWARAGSPAELLALLDASPWAPPTEFLLRSDGDDYTVSLSRDTYPFSPNVQFYDVRLPRSLFDDPAFTTTAVGPYTVVSRT